MYSSLKSTPSKLSHVWKTWEVTMKQFSVPEVILLIWVIYMRCTVNYKALGFVIKKLLT